ncbi:MAG: lipopolysaccharide biosynthesis protein [Cytophagaceae bacterium]|nr:lipopolysaccharide biosynthesis protein [Cytophagaceae bacterium]
MNIPLIKRLNNAHVWSVSANGLTAVINMLTIAVLYRLLPMVDIGVWIFMQTFILFTDTFRWGLLNTAFVKFYAGVNAQRAKEVIGSIWYLALAITGIFCLLGLAGFFLSEHIADVGLKYSLKFLAISLIVTAPTVVALCIAQGESRFDRILYIRLWTNGVFLVLLFLLLIIGQVRLDHVIYANLAANLVGSVVAWAAGWTRIECLPRRSAACIRELFHFGKYNVGTAISSSLFRISDTALINFMLGPAALAVYALGVRLMEVVEIPLRSFTATAMPLLSAAFNRGEKDRFIYLLQKYIGLISWLLIPGALLTMGAADLAIGLIGGNAYRGTEAANIFRLFMLFALLSPADRFMAVALDAIHKPDLNFMKVLLMIVLNLIANWIGIAVLGNIYGIAFGSFCNVLFAVIFSYYALQKYYGGFNLWASYKIGFLELKSTLRLTLFPVRSTTAGQPEISFADENAR